MDQSEQLEILVLLGQMDYQDYQACLAHPVTREQQETVD